MKETYENLELEVIEFDVEDVITASGCANITPDHNETTMEMDEMQ